MNAASFAFLFRSLNLRNLVCCQSRYGSGFSPVFVVLLYPVIGIGRFGRLKFQKLEY